jgi:hypothetical protein
MSSTVHNTEQTNSSKVYLGKHGREKSSIKKIQVGTYDKIN